MLEKNAVQMKKVQLARDAVQWEEQQDAPEWADAAQWPQYMGKGMRENLYRSLSDQDLKDVLCAASHRLGRLPNKKDVFCVYRFFIIRRYGNWPKALVAAGLKRPRRERQMENRCRQERDMLRRNGGAGTAVDCRKSG